jgi:hypothetical protein
LVSVGALAKDDEADLKRLAEMKAYLEKKISDSERETERLRSMVEIVDSLLADKSFRRVKIPTLTQAEPAADVRRQPSEIWPIATPEGTHLADVQMSESEITLVPDPKIRYDVTSPPLRAFLIARVLDPMHAKDEEFARTGQVNPALVLVYELQEEEGILKALRVRNYRDQGRLTELRNAMRWTIRRMYEKTLQAR